VKVSPNTRIDTAIDKLLKECEGGIAADKESRIKTHVEVLKAAMTWEKLKHGIRDKESEGTEWGTPSDGQ
jgi:hypothetical protein